MKYQLLQRTLYSISYSVIVLVRIDLNRTGFIHLLNTKFNYHRHLREDTGTCSTLSNVFTFTYIFTAIINWFCKRKICLLYMQRKQRILIIINYRTQTKHF